MRRQEYIELVNDWNGFLLKEEKRLLNEQLLIESILLNEVNVLNLAKRIGTSSAGLLVFFAAHLAQATPDQVVSNPDEMRRIPATMAAKINSIPDEEKNKVAQEANKITEKATEKFGEITGRYNSETGVSELVTLVGKLTDVGNTDEFGISYDGPSSMKVLGRTISAQEQEVIDLLTLFDTNEKAFKKEMKKSKNISLLCSYGYCYTEWMHRGEKHYQLISPIYISPDNIGEMGIRKGPTGTEAIQQGSAVEFHNKSNSVLNDSRVKKMTREIQKASSSNKPEMRQWAKAMNEFLLMYQKSHQKGQNEKIKRASETFPEMFERLRQIDSMSPEQRKKTGAKIIKTWEKTVVLNQQAQWEGIVEGYIEGVNNLFEKGHITEEHKNSLTQGLARVKAAGVRAGAELLDMHQAIQDAIFYKIYGTNDVNKVIKKYRNNKN